MVWEVYLQTLSGCNVQFFPEPLILFSVASKPKDTLVSRTVFCTVISVSLESLQQ